MSRTKTKAVIKTSTVVAVIGAMSLAAVAAVVSIRPSLKELRTNKPWNAGRFVPGYTVPGYTPTTPGYTVPGYGR